LSFFCGRTKHPGLVAATVFSPAASFSRAMEVFPQGHDRSRGGPGLRNRALRLGSQATFPRTGRVLLFFRLEQTHCGPGTGLGRFSSQPIFLRPHFWPRRPTFWGAPKVVFLHQREKRALDSPHISRGRPPLAAGANEFYNHVKPFDQSLVAGQQFSRASSGFWIHQHGNLPGIHTSTSAGPPVRPYSVRGELQCKNPRNPLARVTDKSLGEKARAQGPILPSYCLDKRGAWGSCFEVSGPTSKTARV